MLIIRGKIVGIDDQILVNAFGRSDQRGDRLGDWIAELIEDDAQNHFNSAAEMRREFLNRNIHNPLPIRLENPLYQGGTDIIMTGRRADDERAANANLGLAATPAGYTWHHCEGIQQVGTGWQCRMRLIQSHYHNTTQHMGGVHEYELMTNNTYQ